MWRAGHLDLEMRRDGLLSPTRVPDGLGLGAQWPRNRSRPSPLGTSSLSTYLSFLPSPHPRLNQSAQREIGIP